MTYGLPASTKHHPRIPSVGFTTPTSCPSPVDTPHKWCRKEAAELAPAWFSNTR